MKCRIIVKKKRMGIRIRTKIRTKMRLRLRLSRRRTMKGKGEALGVFLRSYEHETVPRVA